MESGTKTYYVFTIRTDRNQNVEMQAETFTGGDYNSVNVLLDFSQEVPGTGAILLKRGVHVLIVKQNHNKGDASAYSWITLSMLGQEQPIEQRRGMTR